MFSPAPRPGQRGGMTGTLLSSRLRLRFQWGRNRKFSFEGRASARVYAHSHTHTQVRVGLQAASALAPFPGCCGWGNPGQRNSVPLPLPALPTSPESRPKRAVAEDRRFPRGATDPMTFRAYLPGQAWVIRRMDGEAIAMRLVLKPSCSPARLLKS